MPRIEGLAIVSADGMIADGKREMPDSIDNPADKRFLQDTLDRAAAVLHGQHSHEGGPHADRRKRLILTHRIAATAPDTSYPNALLWNPNGMPLADALRALGAGDGMVAVIGGRDVFDLFLPRYDAFHLTRAARATIPGGLPVFSEVGPNASPDEVLARHGLRPGPRRDLDAAAGISVVTWSR